MAQESQTLFRRLTQLFRSGPVIKRKVRDFSKSSKQTSAFEVFRKTQSHVYSTAMSAYGTYDRMARYSDFSEMEYTPEISSALDIYAEETVSADEKGSVLHIYSENPTIQRLLDELFVFVYKSTSMNARAEAMQGYNDDLVMSLAIGLWVRDTALRLRTEGVLLQKNALKHIGTSEAVYKSDNNENDSWDWSPDGKNPEDLKWLINK